MPKRSYDQISSSGLSFIKQSTTTSITDLPVDVLCLVFKRLPLAEVLRNQAHVCKLFYDAHIQHCRSSVKHLTLLGHYMLKENFTGRVEPQRKMLCKQMLFEYARNTSSISSLAIVNPSSCHLKLVVGLEVGKLNKFFDYLTMFPFLAGIRLLGHRQQIQVSHQFGAVPASFGTSLQADHRHDQCLGRGGKRWR